MKKLLLSLLMSKLSFGASLEHKRIAVYQQEPIASADCAQAVRDVLATKYTDVFIVHHHNLTAKTLSNVDCVVFPGGEEDVDNFDHMIKDRSKVIRNYVANGGRYLGICMGAYITSELYFDILGSTTAEQYIKHPGADVYTMRETVCTCKIGRDVHTVYFYDGPVFEHDIHPDQILATYSNGAAAAIIKPYRQGRVLCVGPHLESTQDWYDTKQLKPHWHGGRHHALLLKMVKKLLE